jgi:hypothetical protein
MVLGLDELLHKTNGRDSMNAVATSFTQARRTSADA